MQAAALLWFGGVLSLTLLWPLLSVWLRMLGCSLLLAILPRLARPGRVSTDQALTIMYQAELSSRSRLQIAVRGSPGQGNSKLQIADEDAPADFDASLKRWCRCQLAHQALQGDGSIILCPPSVPELCRKRAAQVVLESISSGSHSMPELQVLLQDNAQAALWTQEATRLLGPSEPLSPTGVLLDEWETVEPADWEEALHADMPQQAHSHGKAQVTQQLKAQTEE